MELRRKKLRTGDYIDAPGAPRGYRYGDTVFCVKCGHKSVVYRPRKRLWVCGYTDVNGAKCSYVTPRHVPRKRIVGRTGVSGSYTPVKDTLNGDVCGDLVIDVLGEDLALSHIDEMCGDTKVTKSRNRGGRSSFYSGEKIQRYRQKHKTAGM